MKQCICWLEVDVVTGIWDAFRIKHHAVLTRLHLADMSELCLKNLISLSLLLKLSLPVLLSFLILFILASCNMHLPVMFFRCTALFLLELNYTLCSFLPLSQHWPFPQIPGAGSLFSMVLFQLSLVIKCAFFFPGRLLVQPLSCFSNT